MGNELSTKDALGRVTQYQYDGMNRLTQDTDAVGTPQQRTTQIFYDGEGNLTERIGGRGIITQYQFDLRQRLIAETDAVGTPQQRSSAVTYDGDDNRVTVTDPLGRITKYQYDTRNRLTQETDASGTSVQAITQTAYDAVGNVIGRTDADNHTTTSTYDPLNRRSTMTDALGEVTLYFYDGGAFAGSVALGGETVICNQCGATPGSHQVTAQVDPDGTASLHAGTTYTYYDALQRIVINKRFDNRLAAYVEILSSLVQFFQHAGGDVYIDSLYRLHHAALAFEKTRDVFTSIGKPCNRIGRSRADSFTRFLHIREIC